MRLSEFARNISEVKMSPNRLASAASDINALVGIEYEMNVPNIIQDDDDIELIPDMSYDEPTRSIDEIIDFFDSPENYFDLVQTLRRALIRDYEYFVAVSLMESWREQEYHILYAYYQQNGDHETKDDIERAVIYAQTHEVPEFNELKDKFLDDHNDDFTEEDWLKKEYPKMSDILEQFTINWPYMTYPEVNTLEDLANEFQEMIGMKVNWSERYHGAKRTDNAYALEPDSSVESDTDDMTGLEFISPPLRIDIAINHLHRIREWAKQKGCETNETTGLHMNCSIRGKQAKKLDYVKMALFLGDNYILEQFNRVGNEYAQSAFNIIKDKVKKFPSTVDTAFEYMRQGLNHHASQLIHDNSTNKYTSINVKDDGAYLEIRSPGGDWINADLDKLIATLNRIVFAIDVAYSENKYQREYTTKLYKMLASNKSDYIAELFSKFSAGALTAEQLKINWARFESSKINDRKYDLVSKFLAKQKMWNVRLISMGLSARVKAITKEEAYKKGLDQLLIHYAISPNTPMTEFEITESPTSRTSPSANAGQWGRWFVSLDDGNVVPISARNADEAMEIAVAQFPQQTNISVRPGYGSI